VSGGSFFRSYDGVAYTDQSYPATVSDFYLDRFEITVERFRAFVDAGKGTQTSPPSAGDGAHPLIAGSGWDSAWNTGSDPDGPNLTTDTVALKTALKSCGSYSTWTDAAGSNESLPMNCVNWYELFAFCAWDGGRLPTEAEWNYAAAGGSEQREYPWGSATPDSTYAVYDCTGDGSGAGNCAFSDIQPVGSRSPKGDGRYGQSDLAGSMWEWNLDWYAPYQNSCNDCANLSAASGRVVRGGGWSGGASGLRAAYRDFYGPAYRVFSIGARCSRTPLMYGTNLASALRDISQHLIPVP